ncbi:MAG TPA: ABC transporter permease subunit [Methanocellaceae archaeon]|jgi:ABC-2 type transport system permease protein
MAFELFKQAIKDKTMGAVIVAVILFAYILMIATFYTQVASMGDMYAQILSNPSFKALIGDEALSVTTYGGFLGIEVLSYMGIVLGAYIAFLTASFVAGEVEQKTSDLLLSLPVSRENVIISRFLALIPIVALIMLAMLAAIYVGALYVNATVQIEWFAIAMLYMGIFVLAVAAASLFISALMSDGRTAALISIGVLLAMYLIENIGSMVTGIDWLRALSLFHYLKLNTIAVSHVVNWTSLGVLVAFTIVFLVLSVIAFKRRDINIS